MKEFVFGNILYFMFRLQHARRGPIYCPSRVYWLSMVFDMTSESIVLKENSYLLLYDIAEIIFPIIHDCLTLLVCLGEGYHLQNHVLNSWLLVDCIERRFDMSIKEPNVIFNLKPCWSEKYWNFEKFPKMYRNVGRIFQFEDFRTFINKMQ